MERRGTSLEAIWDRAIYSEREAPSLAIDDGVIIDGLVRASATGRVRAQRAAKVKDVDVIIDGDEGRKVAVAVCNAENMTSLAARLKRLAQLNAQKTFAELVIVRDQRLPIKSSAKATQQRLRELSDGGARIVRLSSEAYAALAALRRLLADAAAGDLTLDGKPVQPDELKEWLAANAPAALTEAVEAITGAPAEAAPEQEVVARIHELLVGRWIVPIDAVAAEAKLSLDDLRDVASAEGATFGVIRGEKDLLFLRASAIERA